VAALRIVPIPLTVKLQEQVLVYYFNWKIRESVVKSFVELANSKGMTHEILGIKYKEIGGNHQFNLLVWLILN